MANQQQPPQQQYSALQVDINRVTEKVFAASGSIHTLDQQEKLAYYRYMCGKIGIDPAMHPFKVLETKEKMILYMDREGTQMMCEKHNVTLSITSREEVAGLFLVTARASMPADNNGITRFTESIGAVPLEKEGVEWRTASNGKRYFNGTGVWEPLRGEDRCNAIMKAETKAKRRAALDVLGLGKLDESEVESIRGAQTFGINETPAQQGQQAPPPASQSAPPAQQQQTQQQQAPPPAQQQQAAQQHGGQGQDDPFRKKYARALDIAAMLDAAKTVQDVANLYYINQAIVEADNDLKNKFAATRDALKNQQPQQHQQQAF